MAGDDPRLALFLPMLDEAEAGRRGHREIRPGRVG